jgi:hypothetical protein
MIKLRKIRNYLKTHRPRDTECYIAIKSAGRRIEIKQQRIRIEFERHALPRIGKSLPFSIFAGLVREHTVYLMALKNLMR